MSPDEKRVHQLPKMLERVLASLATYYAKNGNVSLQKLLTNSRYYVHEGYDYDNWDGGQWGHAVHFQVPAQIYHQIF